MTKILKSPAKYVQGPDTLRTLDQYLQGMGQRLLVIISPNGMERMRDTLQSCFAGKPYELTYALFQGECSQRSSASAAARSWTRQRRWPMARACGLSSFRRWLPQILPAAP